jgi:D-amino-acid oxidase
MARPEILVIGAGVSGLTTATCLAEAGWTMRVIAQRPPGQSTSAMAGASWGPYMVEDQRILRWSRVTRLALEEISAEPGTGVRLVNGIEAVDAPMEPPEWAVEVPDFRPCLREELDALPAKYVSGWRYTIPLVDMPNYLDYLEKRLAGAGVQVELETVRSLADVAGRADVLVNCSGLGARKLVPDAAVYPIRGHLVVVENPGVDQFFQDDTHDGELTYILPHGRRVVLGGCAIENLDGAPPVHEIARGIIERCAVIEPVLRDAPVLDYLVGLRPTRHEVRTERVDLDGVPVVHNYGHGGSGVTLSWGCAHEVLDLVNALSG